MNCLISFPASAMRVPDEELDQVAHDSHAVVRDAKEAGVWVFGGALDESAPALLVDSSGQSAEGTYPETGPMSGGFAILHVNSHDEAVQWAARLAQACRCAQELRMFHDDPESLP